MTTAKFRTPNSALITGGSSGIGKAIALDLAKRNINVFLVGRNPANLEGAISEIRSAAGTASVSGASASVSDGDQIAKAVKTAESEIGPIDLLVNSAGISEPGYFEELEPELFAQSMETNYLGTVRTIQSVLPSMQANKYGWIVNISSVAGFKGFFGYTAYCGSKFAVNGFSEALRSELERYNIGVTLVCPPDTRTPMLADEEEKKPIETKRLSASGTLLEPEDVARAVWSGLQRNRFLVIPGFSAKSVYFSNRFAPWLLDWVIRRTIRG